MNAIADALVYAVTYINLRSNDDELEDDADVGALESIAATLDSATEEERNLLASAAKRALAEEASGSRREEFIRDYSTWMEDLFGEGWIGNQRS